MENIEQITDDELAELMRETSTELNHINALRRNAAGKLNSLQDEFMSRRQKREEEAYVEKKSVAALRGAAPPKPPKHQIERPPTSAAASRLAGFSLSLGRPQASPVQQPVQSKEPPKLVITVSDHAVVRYMERAMGFCFDDIRERILSPTVKAAIATGLNRIRTSEGVVVAREGAVVSFLPSDAGPSHGPSWKVKKDPDTLRKIEEGEAWCDDEEED